MRVELKGVEGETLLVSDEVESEEKSPVCYIEAREEMVGVFLDTNSARILRAALAVWIRSTGEYLEP